MTHLQYYSLYWIFSHELIFMYGLSSKNCVCVEGGGRYTHTHTHTPACYALTSYVWTTAYPP